MKKRSGKNNVIRILIIIAAALAVLAVCIGIWWNNFSRQALPVITGTFTLDGIREQVEIRRDKNGVPHILARNMDDLFFAQGYVHAQERFWQMDLNRRIIKGRLSELLGQVSLGIDIYMRTTGFYRVIEENYSLLSGEIKNYYTAYAAGVNSYINKRKPAQLALDFALLELQGNTIMIDAWEPVDSICWILLMCEDLGANKDLELYYANLINKAGKGLADDFFPDYPAGKFPFIIPGSNIAGRTEQDNTSVDLSAFLSVLNTPLAGNFKLDTPLFFGKDPGLGTNSWVISGEKSSTNKPLLACDPHLGIQIPSPWFEMDLKVKAAGSADGEYLFNVHGFSSPSVPGVIFGHNEKIAWGLSIFPADQQDLFIEKINPANSNQYAAGNRWEDFTIRQEKIFISKKEEPYIFDVKSTRHGPVIIENKDADQYAAFLPEKTSDSYALALSWTAFHPMATNNSIIMMNQADDFAEFRNALKDFGSPCLNFVYADTAGNIGYQAAGLVPVRRKGRGELPGPGWTEEYGWQGFISFSKMPTCYNPDQGYIVAANNGVVDNYPYFLSSQFSGSRAKRITEMISETLRANGRISMADMQAMQKDIKDPVAEELIGYLKKVSFPGQELGDALNWLAGWDFRMTQESGQALLYAHFYTGLLKAIFMDQIPKDLYPIDSVKSSWDRLMYALSNLLSEAENGWWDDADTKETTETRDDILSRVFAEAYNECKKFYSDNREKWQWGKAHIFFFRNWILGSSGIPPVEAIFNRGPFHAGGGMQTVSPGNWSVSYPYGGFVISSCRMLADTGNLGASLFIESTGQSGHALDSHYDDQILPWLENRYHQSMFDDDRWQDQERSLQILRNK